MRPELRGRGHGLRIWNAAVAHAGGRTIGLDGVVAQQDNYKKSGFVLAYPNIRYGGTVATSAAPPPEFVPLADVAFAAIAADDATVFPAPREAFLRAWIAARGHMGRALVRDGRLAAWGVIRPCRTGHKIGPLVADDRAAAEAVFAALLAAAGGGQAFPVKSFSTSRASIATRSHWRKPTDWRRCSRPPACIPGRSVHCASSGCSASPPSSWDDVERRRSIRATRLRHRYTLLSTKLSGPDQI